MRLFRISIVSLAATAVSLAQAQLAGDYQYFYNSQYNLQNNCTAFTHDAAGHTFLTGNVQYPFNNVTDSAISTQVLDNTGVVTWATTGRAGLNGENDFAKGVALDAQGNIYVAAEANHTASSSQMMLVKYDPNGNVLWTRFYNPKPGKHNSPTGVGIDSANGIYMAGTAGDGNSQVLGAVKFSTAGVAAWSHTFSRASVTDSCRGMKVMPNGDLYECSYSSGNTGAPTAWVVKYNSAGLKQYDTGITFNPAVIYEPRGMDVGPDGSFCITGISYPIDAEMFVAKFDHTGTYKWSGTFAPFMNGALDSNGGLSVAMGPDGSVYSTGYAQYDSSGYYFATLAKWSSAGTFVYGNKFGFEGNKSKGTSISVDPYSRVYLAANVSSMGQSYCLAGVWVANGLTGSFIAGNVTGDSSHFDQVVQVQYDAQGRVYMAGSSQLPPDPSNYLAERFVQPIQALGNAYTTKFNTVLHPDAAHGLLANDHYVVDGKAVLTSAPSHGMVSINMDGSFTYTPNLGFIGNDVFSYHTVQRSLNGNSALVSVSVTP